jgi:hypothetical protein
MIMLSIPNKIQVAKKTKLLSKPVEPEFFTFSGKVFGVSLKKLVLVELSKSRSGIPRLVYHDIEIPVGLVKKYSFNKQSHVTVKVQSIWHQGIQRLILAEVINQEYSAAMND